MLRLGILRQENFLEFGLPASFSCKVIKIFWAIDGLVMNNYVIFGELFTTPRCISNPPICLFPTDTMAYTTLSIRLRS